MIRILCMLVCGLAATLVAQTDDASNVHTRVNVTSQPAGASVIIDGVDRGITPLMIFDLAPGRHHLKYRLAGYVERNRFFEVGNEPMVERNEVLVEEKGLLLLKTDPADCLIKIDGVVKGHTPRLITDLAVKDTYTVKFEKTGYLPQTITVKFDGREPVVREERLLPAAGAVNIVTDPVGAEVTVNGITRGQSPMLVRDVPKGVATVKFHLDGFEDEVRELQMQAGEQQTLQISLKALPGTLHLLSIPEGARFYVNDKSYGIGPVAIPALEPGDYQVRCEKDGFGTMVRTVTINNGSSAREEFRLSNEMGRLELRTDPAGVTVIFDGQNLGVTKSQAEGSISVMFPIERILEGEHTLVLKKDGYAETTRHPKIKSMKTSQANVRLKRLFIPDVEIFTDRGSYRGILISNAPDAVTIEVSLGITRSFARSEIRKLEFLAPNP